MGKLKWSIIPIKRCSHEVALLSRALKPQATVYQPLS